MKDIQVVGGRSHVLIGRLLQSGSNGETLKKNTKKTCTHPSQSGDGTQKSRQRKCVGGGK